MSEIVSHNNNQFEEIRKFFSQNEMLEDPITRRDYFEHIDENEFLLLLQQTASLVRTGEASQYQSFDGKTVGLMMHEVPDQREKDELLRATWRAVLEILKDRSLDDQDALDYAGLTMAGGVLLTHPFADGNGRTTRTLSYLMMRGTENATEIEGIIGESGGGGGWQVTPLKDLTASFKRSFTGKQPSKIEWEDHFVGEGHDAFGGMVTNSDYENKIVRRFIEQADEETLKLINQAVHVGTGDAGETVLDANKMLEIIATSDGAIDYAQKFSLIMRDERALAVSGFLHGMTLHNFNIPIINWIKLNAERSGTDVREERSISTKHEIAKRVLYDGTMSLRDQSVVSHKAVSAIYTVPNNVDK